MTRPMIVESCVQIAHRAFHDMARLAVARRAATRLAADPAGVARLAADPAGAADAIPTA